LFFTEESQDSGPLSFVSNSTIDNNCRTQMIYKDHDEDNIFTANNIFRQIEVNIIKFNKPIPVCLIFEALPCWLMALDPSRFCSVIFHDHVLVDHLLQSIITQKFNPLIVKRAIGRFGLTRCSFIWETKWIPLHLYYSVVLENFIASHLQDSSRPIITITGYNYMGRIREGHPVGISSSIGLGHVTWNKVQHGSVGGCTTY
jgi:hypothetical protein